MFLLDISANEPGMIHHSAPCICCLTVSRPSAKGAFLRLSRSGRNDEIDELSTHFYHCDGVPGSEWDSLPGKFLFLIIISVWFFSFSCCVPPENILHLFYFKQDYRKVYIDNKAHNLK